MNSIKYEDEALVITLKCSEPAALHSALMQSIAANMHRIVSSAQNPNSLSDDVYPLINLLQTILPTERQLTKAFL